MDFRLDLWIEYLIRFSHLVAGIAWIGSSFYFIWLDSSFLPPEKPRHNVEGEVFMVHGGFYYQVDKRKIYPGEIPKILHWFKWEATLTWLTGFLLLIVLYFLHGASLLIDPQVSALTQALAVGLSLGILVMSWLIYDFLIWPPSQWMPKPASVVLSAIFFGGMIYLLSHVFSGRGAFILSGAIFGTMMLLNVWVRILPGQAKMLREAQAGQVPDYSVSLKSKVRSVHNTYFIFPVLFIMLSNHYPSLYNHKWNWALLIMLSISGALTRHAMVTKVPKERWTLLPAATVLGALVFMAAGDNQNLSGGPVDYAQVKAIIDQRCLWCHSTNNKDDIYKVAPLGIIFESEEQVRKFADKIRLQVVVAKTMPLANKTQMTDAERDVFARWLNGISTQGP